MPTRGRMPIQQQSCVEPTTVHQTKATTPTETKLCDESYLKSTTGSKVTDPPVGCVGRESATDSTSTLWLIVNFHPTI